MVMKVLIIEDEERSAKRLERMLREYDPAIQIIGILDSIEDSVRWFRGNKEPDLVFLDIQLADGDSFSIFDDVNPEAPVIFTTAYNEYAIEAFKLNSIDYLLKPVKKEQLIVAIKKFEKLFGSAEHASHAYLKRMMIRIGDTIKSIEIDKTSYFYIEDKSTYAVMMDGSRFPVDYSLEKLETRLDPERFFRINRQFIISFQSLKRMVSYSKSRIKIILEPPCDIDAVSSSEKTPYFKDWLNGQADPG